MPCVNVPSQDRVLHGLLLNDGHGHNVSVAEADVACNDKSVLQFTLVAHPSTLSSWRDTHCVATRNANRPKFSGELEKGDGDTVSLKLHGGTLQDHVDPVPGVRCAARQMRLLLVFYQATCTDVLGYSTPPHNFSSKTHRSMMIATDPAGKPPRVPCISPSTWKSRSYLCNVAFGSRSTGRLSVQLLVQQVDLRNTMAACPMHVPPGHPVPAPF